MYCFVLTGLTEVNINLLEKGRHSPRPKTKEVIESVLGLIDWKLTKRIGELKNQYGSIKIGESD